MGYPTASLMAYFMLQLIAKILSQHIELRVDERIVTERCFSLTDPNFSNVCRTSQFDFKLKALPPILLLETLMNTTSSPQSERGAFFYSG